MGLEGMQKSEATEISGPEPSAASAESKMKKRKKGGKETPSSAEADQAAYRQLEAQDEQTATKEPEKDYKAVKKEYVMVDPKVIQPIKHIPPYILPTRCGDPQLLKGPDGFYCLDGEELIRVALEKGADIRCHVAYYDEISELEMAGLKVAFRNAPQGGRALWAENVRNGEIYYQLYADKENVSVPSHGGRRRGAGSAEELQNNVRDIMARCMEKSRGTIDKLRTHAEHLDRATLDALVLEKTNKERFEEIQKVKGKLVNDLKSEGASEEEIVKQASEAVLSMARDPKKIEEIWARLTQAPAEESVGASQKNTRSAKNGHDASSEILHAKEEFEEHEDENAEAEEEPADAHRDAEKEEPPVTPTESSENQEDRPSSEEELRSKGLAIADKIKEIFANREVRLRDALGSIKSVNQSLIELQTEIQLT